MRRKNDEYLAINTAIGDRVRARRENLGLTQSDLARSIGVTFQQIQKYESGANRISAPTLILIGAALGCKGADFLPETPPAIESKVAGQVELEAMTAIWFRLPDDDRQQLLALARHLARRS